MTLRDQLMTEDEVATVLRTNKLTVRYWRQQGKLESVKIGKHPLIFESEVLRFLSKYTDSSKSNPVEYAKMQTVGGKAGGKL